MAISPIQSLANQLNALRSTGPRTVAGKAQSSVNARKHGILSRQLIIEGESAEDFGALLEELLADEAPVGTLECALVERLAICLWRQRRAVTAESASLHLQRLTLAEPEWRLIQQLSGADLDLIRATLADGLTLESAQGVSDAFEAWLAVPDADKPQDLAGLEARFPPLLDLLQGVMTADAALLVELAAPESPATATGVAMSVAERVMGAPGGTLGLGGTGGTDKMAGSDGVVEEDGGVPGPWPSCWRNASRARCLAAWPSLMVTSSGRWRSCAPPAISARRACCRRPRSSWRAIRRRWTTISIR